ncbi:unnamed protein product [Caenorhabditis bovis]|uniref:Ubiquitin-like domain-containing protein n=1 Tax=Caenorhabditis bovis TaxID=2654633 RepID=A0A8S1F300_9PELO|nr:unnamed protein product [Caenorhabditis bovis]
MSEDIEPSTPAEIELVIRSGHQSAEDLIFTCPMDWTIRRVKEHIKTLSSSHPEVSAQRLIFSGVFLKDEQVLSTIIRERSVVDGAQVFHLVCSEPYVEQRTPPHPRTDQQESNNSQSAPQSPEPADAPPQMTWDQWWALQGQTTELQAQYEAYYNAWIRYYNSYQYYLATNPAFLNEMQNRMQNATVIQAHVAYNHAAPANAQNPPNAQPQPPAGPVNPGERVDILEIFYRLFKLVLLFSAVLLYSSFERFFLVLTCALFIYIVQLRRNHVRNRAASLARENRRNAAAAAANADGAQAGEGAGAENSPVNNNNTGENNADAPPAAAPSTVHVFIATCYSFITSFFASLVPDHPLPVDMN